MADTVKPEGRGWFRRTLLQIEIGAALGIIGWAFVGSSLISWWYKPPVDQVNSCVPMVRAALTDFTQYQLIAAGVGVALVVIIGNLARNKSVSPPAPPPIAPTP